MALERGSGTGVYTQKKYPPQEITLAMISVGTGNN